MADRFERLAFSIAEITRAWHKLAADEMAQYGLKGPLAMYLIVLSRYEDGLTATQLSERVGKDKADVSRAVALFEEKGFLKKDEGHAYRARLRLTDEGKRAARHIRKQARIGTAIVGSEISEQERAVFYKTLEYIAERLDALSEEGLPKSSHDAS